MFIKGACAKPSGWTCLPEALHRSREKKRSALIPNPLLLTYCLIHSQSYARSQIKTKSIRDVLVRASPKMVAASHLSSTKPRWVVSLAQTWGLPPSLHLLTLHPQSSSGNVNKCSLKHSSRPLTKLLISYPEKSGNWVREPQS